MNTTSRLAARLLAVASVVTVVGSGCGGSDHRFQDRRCYRAYASERCLGPSHPLLLSLIVPRDPDAEVVEGPYRGGTSGTDCCYVIETNDVVITGRPLPVDGTLVVASLRRGAGDWK